MLAFLSAHKMELFGALFALSELLGLAGKGGISAIVASIIADLAGKGPKA